MKSRIIRWRGQRARLGTWRGGDAIAYLTPFPDTPPLDREFIEHALDEARAGGFGAAVTGALTPAESLGFADAGFVLHEELRLLEHDLVHLPETTANLRRARRTDRPGVIALDSRSFDDFWRLDEEGLDDAINATPWSRFRVADDPDHEDALVGYAVSGRAGPRGYVQRLAVEPAGRRRGVGRSLLGDSLGWMLQRGVQRALVNTHADNEAALALYRSCGFRLLPAPLRIMTRKL
jgi:ribosomal-protein-alanine N-acetyltransferase